MRDVPIHYLRDNKSERSPRRLCYLDTESICRQEGDREVHILRCWVARLEVREGRPGATVKAEVAQGEDALSLVTRIEGWARTRAALWIVAHNLAFDLTCSRLLRLLVGRGWELGKHGLANDAPWAQLSKGEYRITLVDSTSWLPRSIERLGALLDLSKPALPADDDSAEAWFERCHADVRILAAAYSQLLDWWDRRRLGRWTVTGVATAWNCYRHHPEMGQVLIDPNPHVRAAERSAIYGGRRDVWQTGLLPKGRYVMIDLERAHLTAARCFGLPRERGSWFSRLPLDALEVSGGGWPPIARCVVRTRTPRYPWHAHGRVWHPVGTFETVLCGPEIAEAQRRGELVSVGPGYHYRVGATMRYWAQWVSACLDGEDPDVPPMAAVFLKMCSQRVFGKWAAWASRPIEGWPSTEPNWTMSDGFRLPGGIPMTILHYDSWAHPQLRDQESDNAFPAVLAWVQSIVRVAYGRLCDALEPDRLVFGHTDGVLYRCEVDPDLERLARATAPFVPRIKDVYEQVEVLGAAHAILDGELRMSGVPSKASPTGERRFTWHTWPSMRQQLRLAEPRGYVRELREVAIGEIPVPAWVHTDGSVSVVECHTDSLGGTTILPYWPGVAANHRAPLCEVQCPELTALGQARAGLPGLLG